MPKSLPPMDISSIRLIPLPLIGTEARTGSTWQTGEILEATVLASQPGSLTLKLSGAQIQAQSNLQFSPGQHLRLQVTDPGELPVLRLLGESTAPTFAEVQGRTLRMALPQQGPLAPVFKDLLRFAQSVPGGGESSRAVLSALATEILAHLPQASDLVNPKGLKQAIRGSGLFLEARLAALAPGGSLPEDLKADLLRLEAAAQTTSPLPPPSIEESLAGPYSSAISSTSSEPTKNLLQAVQGALAGMEVNQINMLDGGILALELPIRRGNEVDVLALVVEEGEASPDGRGGVLRPWTATLRFDLEGLGAVWTRVTVAREVSVLFQTERPEVSQALGTYLDTLRLALADAGLNPGRLSAQTGPLPSLPRRKPSVPLLDERA